MKKYILPLLLLPSSCTDEHLLAPVECTEMVCAELVGAAPITFLWGTGWDWRTEESCLSTMTCGADPSRCVEAVRILPRVGPGSDPSASLSHIYAVWEACGRASAGTGFGGGGGGRSASWRK